MKDFMRKNSIKIKLTIIFVLSVIMVWSVALSMSFSGVVISGGRAYYVPSDGEETHRCIYNDTESECECYLDEMEVAV